mgnify:CR=1 FL=1
MRYIRALMSLLVHWSYALSKMVYCIEIMWFGDFIIFYNIALLAQITWFIDWFIGRLLIKATGYWFVNHGIKKKLVKHLVCRGLVYYNNLGSAVYVTVRGFKCYFRICFCLGLNIN